MDYLSMEEKIDYIYKELKAQKRARIFWLIFKLVIFLLILYFYFFIFPNLDFSNYMWEFSNFMADIVWPIVEKVANDTSNTASGIDQETIKNLINNMHK